MKLPSSLLSRSQAPRGRSGAEHGVARGPGLRRDPRLLEHLQRSIDALNARQASYSTIKKWAILEQDFTVASGELTPTLKVKRKVVTERYRALLDAFYAE